MATTPSLAIIIPHYNDPVRLRRCLEGLRRNETEGAEIVVVDNNSPTPLDEVSAAYPEIRFITETEKGASPARNRGVAETTAPTLLFIDADCVPADDWVARARAVLKPDTVHGGRVTVFDETDPPRSGAEAFETVFAFDFRSYIEDKGFTGTGNLLTTREVFERTGPLIPGVSEDLEWSRRAVSKGFALVYEHEMVVSHPTRQDWPALRGKWRRMILESWLLHCQENKKAAWGIKALAMPFSPLPHIPKVLRHEDLSGLEKRRAIATLFRIRWQRAVWMLQLLAGRDIR